jgi:hypothetical protein
MSFNDEHLDNQLDQRDYADIERIVRHLIMSGDPDTAKVLLRTLRFYTASQRKKLADAACVADQPVKEMDIMVTPFTVLKGSIKSIVQAMLLGCTALVAAPLYQDLIRNYPWAPIILMWLTAPGATLTMRLYARTETRIDNGSLSKAFVHSEILGHMMLMVGIFIITPIGGSLFGYGKAVASAGAAILGMVITPIAGMLVMVLIDHVRWKIDKASVVGFIYDNGFYLGFYLVVLRLCIWLGLV